MPLDVILGAQWGDEGKGRITDLLAKNASVVARYSGGDNAGHTVTVGDDIFKLHLLPSGLVNPDVIGVLGHGMVINPKRLLEEMGGMAERGLDVSPTRVRISYAAHLITPVHIALDGAAEVARGDQAIGTTKRGIGPAYTDRSARRGLRLELLRNPEALSDAVKAHVEAGNQQLTQIYGRDPLDATAIAAEYHDHARRLAPYIVDTSLVVHQALQAGKPVLAEGAQGTLLDVGLGTYPYVTSSSPTIGGVLTGLGVGPGVIGRIVGVTKAFQTRVGEGPFPTEAEGETAVRLRGTGANPWDEFGTTTGRPRRCGWLDLVLLRYSIRVNGINELALTKLDVLSGLPQVRLCVAYQEAETDARHEELPLGPTDLAPFRAEFEDLPGWSEDVTAARHWNDLPPAAQAYVERIGALTGVPVTMISVGPEREQIIWRK